MNSLFEKIRSIGPELSHSGEVYLFALVERSDSEGKWDVLFSSERAHLNLKESIDFIAAKLIPVLSQSELLALSRVVVLNPDAPIVRALTAVMRIENGMLVVRNNKFDGVLLKNAVLFRSMRPDDHASGKNTA